MIKSAFQNHFANIPQINRPRSQFKRVSRHKHTFDEGLLIPFYLDEVLPGDTFNVKCQMFSRLATPIFPIMDNMYQEIFWFYVPNRLVWENFVKQHGEQIDPEDSTDYTTPVIDNAKVTTAVLSSLWDNYGLPIVGQSYLDKISALPFRMYNLIWNTWFRDQDLQDSLPVPLGDGPDDYDAIYKLQRIGKYKDYFTTARPAPQKGPAVELPLIGSAPLTLNSDGTSPNFDPEGTPGVNRELKMASASANVQWSSTPGSTDDVVFGNNVGITGIADLSQASGPTVNLFREAVTVQQMYELDMRGGTRFIEMIFNHFGVVNPDFRLQRPEFLGYDRTLVNIHPVPQTSGAIGPDGDAGSESLTPQGNLAAFGTAYSRAGFFKTFTEFGYVIGLVAVRADLSYQEKVDRHWSRQTRMDYYYPIMANIGEQALLNQEIYVNPAASTGNTDGFGFQERWAEYRFKTNDVTGLFRSAAAQSLDAWHLAQEFSALPELDENFVVEDAPVDRCIAIQDEPHFIMDCNVTNIAARPMPMYSSPGLTRI